MPETITCPICEASGFRPWAEENGWSAVRCLKCECVYVNPRPSASEISEAARTGLHSTEDGRINTTGRFWSGKARNFKNRLALLSQEPRELGPSPRWMDIGCGFGELLIAVRELLPSARIEGLEPSEPKRRFAIRKGLSVSERPLASLPSHAYDVVSLMNVFSHLPDPKSFLREMTRILKPGGCLIILTGNGADVERCNYPGPLYLPDHLVFAGQNILSSLLARQGFTVVSRLSFQSFFTEDGITRALKNAARMVLGRPVVSANNGPFRDLLFKARLQNGSSA